MQKKILSIVLLFLGGAVHAVEYDRANGQSWPKPTVRKSVTIPSTWLPQFQWNRYMNTLSTDELEELVQLLDEKIETASGRTKTNLVAMRSLAQEKINFQLQKADDQ